MIPTGDTMDLPMKGQPGMEQQQQPAAQQPVQPQQGQGQGQKPFPSGPAEALKFSNDLLEVIYTEKVHANIVRQLERIPENVPDGQGIGMVSAHLVGERIADVRSQTGRPIEMKLVADSLKAVIGEISEISEEYEIRDISGQEKVEAMKVGIQILDQMSKGNAQNES